MGILKDLFTKVTDNDKSCFYTFEKIYAAEPRHYVIKNCTNGFMVLMKKSNIPCDIVEIERKVDVQGNGHFDLKCDNEIMASVLFDIMRRKGRY